MFVDTKVSELLKNDYCVLHRHVSSAVGSTKSPTVTVVDAGWIFTMFQQGGLSRYHICFSETGLQSALELCFLVQTSENNRSKRHKALCCDLADCRFSLAFSNLCNFLDLY